MGNTDDDHRVNGRTTRATAALSTTLGRRKILARKVRRRATREWRVAKHCRRRTVLVRLATRGGDVVRPGIYEERPVGWRGIAEVRVWWRWWEGVHGEIVARGFALCITTALNDKGVGSNNCISNNDNA
jgi:hypothetical protein